LICLSPHRALPDAHTQKHELDRTLAVCREGGRAYAYVHARNNKGKAPNKAFSINERER
jgi:hypothetical protein